MAGMAGPAMAQRKPSVASRRIALRPYQPGDLDAIEPRRYEGELQAATGRSFAQIFASGPAFTLWAAFEDGWRAVGAGGVVPLWRSVGEAWMYLSPWIYRHPTVFAKIVRLALDGLAAQYRWERIQAPIPAHLQRHRRFARWLGFVEEGLLRRYGPEGADYVMTARVACAVAADEAAAQTAPTRHDHPRSTE